MRRTLAAVVLGFGPIGQEIARRLTANRQQTAMAAKIETGTPVGRPVSSPSRHITSTVKELCRTCPPRPSPSRLRRSTSSHS